MIKFLLTTWVSILLLIGAANASTQEEPLLWQPKEVANRIQFYSHQLAGEWVKYSGALGFGYPYKTSPQAIYSRGTTYFTYSRCVTTPEQNYMIVYVANDHREATVVRRIFSPQCDPHENASLHIDKDGYIYVYQSARGKWRKGYVFKSDYPYSIESFTMVDQGYYAYPKPHTEGLVYTDYNQGLRETWIKNKQCNKKLVQGGSYAITTDVGGEIHLVYNYHFAGNLDSRVNLYYMWSRDGCNWFNRDGTELALPVAENSIDTVISVDYHKFNYLKDLEVIDGEVTALVVQSTSPDPTKGNRELLTFKMNGIKRAITNTGHNYDGAQFWKEDIIVSKSNEYGYAGGYLHLFSSRGEYKGTFRGKGAASYPITVDNSDQLMYADTESSSEKKDTYLYIVE